MWRRSIDFAHQRCRPDAGARRRPRAVLVETQGTLPQFGNASARLRQQTDISTTVLYKHGNPPAAPHLAVWRRLLPSAVAVAGWLTGGLARANGSSSYFCNLIVVADVPSITTPDIQRQRIRVDCQKRGAAVLESGCWLEPGPCPAESLHAAGAAPLPITGGARGVVVAGSALRGRGLRGAGGATQHTCIYQCHI